MNSLRLQHSLSLNAENPPKRQIEAVLDGTSSASDIASATAEAINLAQATSEPGFILIAAPNAHYAGDITRCIRETVQAFDRTVVPDKFNHNGWTERFKVSEEATEASYGGLQLWKISIDLVTEFPEKQ